jgi:hypothetical protein
MSESYPLQPAFADDDFIISDHNPGYYVSQLCQIFDDWDAAINEIVEQMITDNFYPNVWYVNDHGNVTLLSINPYTRDAHGVKAWV